MNKDIFGFEDLYSITDTGEIYSKRRNTYLAPKINKYGYKEVCLFKDDKRYYMRVHRLVAEHFCEHPENCNVVNHLDGNKLNNKASNLEWTTVQGNTKHAYDNNFGNMKEIQLKASKKGAEKSKKKVAVYKDGIYFNTYNSKEICAKELGVNPKTIFNCNRENRPSREGLTFFYQKGVSSHN